MLGSKNCPPKNHAARARKVFLKHLLPRNSFRFPNMHYQVMKVLSDYCFLVFGSVTFHVGRLLLQSFVKNIQICIRQFYKCKIASSFFFLLTCFFFSLHVLTRCAATCRACPTVRRGHVFPLLPCAVLSPAGMCAILPEYVRHLCRRWRISFAEIEPIFFGLVGGSAFCCIKSLKIRDVFGREVRRMKLSVRRPGSCASGKRKVKLYGG